MFKEAKLCWRLYKHQAHFQGTEYIKYKRPSRIRWVEHQVAALKSHIHDFPVFIGFCNNQITNPHNNQIKKIKAKLEGFKDDIYETECLVFEAVKFDILLVLLLTPKVMSVCRKVMRSFNKLLILLDHDGGDVFQRDDIYPTESEILKKLTYEEEEIIPERRTQAAVSDNPNNDYCQFCGYLLKCNLQDAIESCHQEFVTVTSSLKESLALWLESILENDIFKVVSVILDSDSYQFLESDVVYDEVKVVDYFKSPLLAKTVT